MLSFLLSSGTKPIRSQLLPGQISTQMVYTHPTRSDGCFRVRRGGDEHIQCKKSHSARDVHRRQRDEVEFHYM